MELLTWQGWLMVAYAAAGAVGVAAYLPQAWALWVDETGSKNVPLSTWSLWGGQVTVYLLYALLVNGDPAFIVIMAATFTVTHLCLGLLLYNRFLRRKRAHRLAQRPTFRVIPPAMMGECY